MGDILHDFGLVLGLSVIGVFLIILRRRGIGNPNDIDSLELLILIMVPVAASIPLFAEPKDHLFWWLGVYIGGTMTWFIIGFTKFSRLTDEPRIRRVSNSMHATGLIVSIYIGIIVYWMLVNLVPLFMNQPKGMA